MNTMPSTPEATAMPVFSAANPARNTYEQGVALDQGAYVNEFYELVYPEATQWHYSAEGKSYDGPRGFDPACVVCSLGRMPARS